MRLLRRSAVCFLILVAGISLAAGFVAPYDYAMQFREHANAPPSRAFPLGTDELGRDRLSRLLAGSRVSLLCAPTAALVATAIAAAIGMVAGYFGGWLDETATALTDLFLSLPWLFVLLTLRSLLPLNVTPWASTAATLLLLGGVCWASG